MLACKYAVYDMSTKTAGTFNENAIMGKMKPLINIL
jgi:hypothetical protein